MLIVGKDVALQETTDLLTRSIISHYFTVLPALLVLRWKGSMLFCKRLLVC